MVQGISARELKDEQISLKSETVSYQCNALAMLDEVVDWIYGIPLSKKVYARNLARDFSDAVVMAEIIKFYYPNLVSPHNYVAANSIQGKRDNWNVLNRKVLVKIGMKLSPDIIESLVHSQNGVIERVLLDFRNKQIPPSSKIDRTKSTTNLENNDTGMNLKKQQEREEILISTKVFRSIVYFFVRAFRIVVVIFCFWKWFSSSSSSSLSSSSSSSLPSPSGNKKSSEKNDKKPTLNVEGNQIRESYLKALEDLDRHYEAIKSLRYKVAFLEGTIKLKDAKIASLQNEVDNKNRSSEVHSARINFDSANKARIPLIRPKTQI